MMRSNKTKMLRRKKSLSEFEGNQCFSMPNTSGSFCSLSTTSGRGQGILRSAGLNISIKHFDNNKSFFITPLLAMINISNNLVATCSREKSKGLEGQRDAISHGECTWGYQYHHEDGIDGEDDDSEGQH